MRFSKLFALIITFSISILYLRSVIAFDEYNLGDTGIEKDVLKLMKANPGKLIMFTDMRYDGAGAEILPMVLNAAYAQKRGWVYGGAIRGPPEGNVLGDDPHGQNVADIANFVFGRRVAYARSEGAALIGMNFSVATLKYTQVSAATPCIEQPCKKIVGLDQIKPPWLVDILWLRETNLHEVAPYKLPKVNLAPMLVKRANAEIEKIERKISYLDYIATPSFIENFRMNMNKQIRDEHIVFSKDRKGPNVALHVRRGKDVDPNVQYSLFGKTMLRYTRDEYYFDLVARIRSVYPNAEFHVFSSLENVATKADYQGYIDRGMMLHFEELPIINTWASMMNADILIMAKSSFSFLPGMLNPNCVIYDEFSFEWRVFRWWAASQKVTKNYIENCFQPTKEIQ